LLTKSLVSEKTKDDLIEERQRVDDYAIEYKLIEYNRYMDADIKQEFEKLNSFLRKHMVTRLEFSELSSRVEDIQGGMRTLQASVDAYAKQSKDYYQEVTVVIVKVNRIERFLTEVVAPKLGVRYDV